MDGARVTAAAAPPPTADTPGPFLGGWHFLVPILALAAVRDLWAPDEPRYAQIAREAFESGSLLVLHLCGELYPDKPPLVYWLAGLLGSLAGWSEFALRLPSIAATIGSAWLTGRMARRFIGPVAGRWAPLFFLGSALVLWMGARLQLDPVLSFLTLAAVDQIWKDGGTARARTACAARAGLWTGLAALAKGPVAWLIVGLALVASRLVPRSARVPLRFTPGAWTAMLVLSVAPVAAWAALASWSEPELARPLFFGQHLGRATTADAPHAGPPWEHALEMSAFVMPWTLLVWLGIAETWRAWRASRTGGHAAGPGLVRAGLWFALVFAVFSAIPPKREVYVLPLYPAAAWFAAAAFQRALQQGRLARWVSIGTPVLLLAASLGAGIAVQVVHAARPYAGLAAPTTVCLAAGAGAALAFRSRGNLPRWADSIALGLSTAALAAAVWIVPAVDAVKSARSFARVIAERPEQPARIPCVGVQPEGYRFYSGVPTVRGNATLLAQARDQEGREFLALVEDRQWPKLAPELRARLVVLASEPVGSRSVLLVGAAP